MVDENCGSLTMRAEALCAPNISSSAVMCGAMLDVKFGALPMPLGALCAISIPSLAVYRARGLFPFNYGLEMHCHFEHFLFEM